MGIPITMALLFAVGAVQRGKINSANKAFFILASAYAIGVTSLLLYGQSANGTVFLVSFCIMVFFYFGQRVGVLSVLLVAATEFILLRAQRSGVLEFTDLHALEPSPTLLLAGVIPYVLCGFVPLMVLRSVANQLVLEAEKKGVELAALKKAEREYKNIFDRLERAEEIGRTGGWEADIKSGKVTWTRGTYLIHDLDPADEAGFENYLRTHGDAATRTLKAILPNALKSDNSFEVEMSFETVKGNSIWVNMRGICTFENGEIVRLEGYTQDVSARKAAEEYSAKLLNRLEKSEEITRTGTWFLDFEAGEVVWDRGLLSIFELDSPDGRSLTTKWEDNQKRQPPSVLLAIERAKEDGLPYDIEFELNTAKGRCIWAHSHGEPVIRNGKVVGIEGYTQDITARKQAQEQLRASQKMEAVGQLTAGIAHDFNNLLAVVSANLELMEEDVEGSPKLAKRVAAALKAVDRGADLTQHLLAFGRNQALSPKRLNLCDVVQHSAKLITRTLPGSIAIQVMADPKADIWANVDEGQLENALLNLALNARDAMPDGGTLLFSLGTRDVGAGKDERRKSVPPGRYGVITVQDTGKGMSAEVMAKAFDPFFTTKPVGQGTGLGLSMVYGFIRQSGGRVQLTSTEGQGTTFTLLFPLADAADKDATSGQSTQATMLLAGPRSVLLVEDMADVRESILAQLESLGLEVTTAEDATTALALLSSGKSFDLLLTDLGLPGAMDGDDLANLATDKVPDIKIITMTGYNKDRVAGLGFPVGPNRAHLRKPFKRAELQMVMHTLFEEQAVA